MSEEMTQTTHSENPAWFDGKKINEALFCEEFLRDYKLAFESSVSTESTKNPEIQFSEFKLYTGEANTQQATLVSTGHNDAAGNITFSNRLSFDHAGTYFFGVVEKKMDGSITSDRHWYKVAVTVGTKTEKIAASNLKDIIKNTYYIKSIKVEQFMNTEGHGGMWRNRAYSQYGGKNGM